EMILLPGGDGLFVGLLDGSGDDPDSLGGDDPGVPFVNYQLYEALGADYALTAQLAPDSSVRVIAYDVHGETVAVEYTPVSRPEDPDFRMSVHRVADAITRLVTGTEGIAATRMLWVRGRELWVVDADGHGARRVPTGGPAYSPTWHPSGDFFAYVEFPGSSKLLVQDLFSGSEREVFAGGAGVQDFAPDFSRDGETLAFARAGSDGTDVYAYNFRDDCCLQRLTVGRFSDNLSPTFSPDGRQIAYVSTRPGLPQIYVMTADGTGQELFAPFDFGVTGGSYAPEWSDDGLNLAFHRDVAGSPQVFIMDVAGRSVKQLTSAGRNEDPTWAPDGRHLAFVSSRTGTRQIWIIDLETGRARQVTRNGNARLPTWSARVEGR
ncbi:MAG: DPP IV N-terminal domain-containing protein, partial [Gemmatimonadales bacterium]